jgi:hypothetical protein
MSTPLNAAPFTNWLGIQDDSTAQQLPQPLQVPTHLPLCPMYTPWGPTAPTLTTPANITSTFGANVFNTRSAFFTHQSLYAETILDEGNQIMIQRIIPSDAPAPARMLLSLDFVAEPALPQYQRNSDGSYFLNSNGQKVQITGAGATAPGFIGKWVLNTIPSDAVYGEVPTQAGSITNSAAVQSQLFPILEFEATFQGSQGNNQALRLLVPTGADASNPLNVPEAERVGAWIMRMQMLTRVSATASWNILNTQSGQSYADFTLLPNAYDDTTSQNLDFQFALSNGYSAKTPGFPRVYGPFETAHIYQSNLTSTLALVGAKEVTYGTLPASTFTGASDPNLYLVNLFTAVSLENVPYYSLTLQGSAAGGQIFTSNSSFPAVGGGDGTMTATTFDADVATWIGGFDALDMAMYPFSTIYDSGFSLTTKYALISLLGQRPDIWLNLVTQDATQAQNTPDQDLSTAQALSAMVGTYPESVVYGTAACRADIVGGSGYLLSGTYSGIVPLSLQLAQTFAAYMGAANGQWNSTVPPDENPYNIITLFENTNTAYMSATARNAAWNAGLIWAEAFDMQSQYFPALASVYTNDTSVLKALMNVIIAVDLIKIAHQARRTLSGISSLTSAQFVQRSNQLIINLVKGRYAGRVQVVPNTYYTAADTANGYSWSCAITMYANNMMTVGSATVIAQRMSALAGTTGTSG